MIHSCVCVAQLDRAFGYGPKGRGFESSSARLRCVCARLISEAEMLELAFPLSLNIGNDEYK